MVTSVSSLQKLVLELAKEVYSILGEGYKEEVYQDALCIELRNKKIKYSKERNVEILYKCHSIGIYRLDIVVENKLIVELKAVKILTDKYLEQLQGYMKTTEWKNGILINFPTPQKNDIEKMMP